MKMKEYVEKINKEIYADKEFIDEVANYFGFDVEEKENGMNLRFNGELVIPCNFDSEHFMPSKTYILQGVNEFLRIKKQALEFEQRRLNTLFDNACEEIQKFIESKYEYNDNDISIFAKLGDSNYKEGYPLYRYNTPYPMYNYPQQFSALTQPNPYSFMYNLKEPSPNFSLSDDAKSIVNDYLKLNPDSSKDKKNNKD